MGLRDHSFDTHGKWINLVGFIADTEGEYAAEKAADRLRKEHYWNCRVKHSEISKDIQTLINVLRARGSRDYGLFVQDDQGDGTG